MNKNKKIILVLTGLLAIQTIGALLIYSNKNANVTTIGHQRQQLLNDWQLNEITQLAIRDERGQLINLVNNDGEWVLPMLNQYPADQQKVISLLKRLLAMSSNYLVSESENQQMAMEVSFDKYRRVIQLFGPDKTTTLFIGNAPTSSYCHVRLDSDHKIWAIAGLDEWQFPTALESWYSHKYETMPIPSPESSALLAIDGTSLHITLAHAPNEAWHWTDESALTKMPPDQTILNEALEEISNIEFSTVAGRLEDPEMSQLWDSPKKLKATIKITNSQALSEKIENSASEETTINTIYLWPKENETTLVYNSGASHIVIVENLNLESFYRLIK